MSLGDRAQRSVAGTGGRELESEQPHVTSGNQPPEKAIRGRMGNIFDGTIRTQCGTHRLRCNKRDAVPHGTKQILFGVEAVVHNPQGNTCLRCYPSDRHGLDTFTDSYSHGGINKLRAAFLD